jgi:hypothetical protein
MKRVDCTVKRQPIRRFVRINADGHLIYCADELRIQRQDIPLARSRPVPLYRCPAGAERRDQGSFEAGHVRLGSNPGPRTGRQNRVEDVPVPERRQVSCAHPHERPKSGRPQGGRYRQNTAGSPFISGESSGTYASNSLYAGRLFFIIQLYG